MEPIYIKNFDFIETVIPESDIKQNNNNALVPVVLIGINADELPWDHIYWDDLLDISINETFVEITFSSKKNKKTNQLVITADYFDDFFIRSISRYHNIIISITDNQGKQDMFFIEK